MREHASSAVAIATALCSKADAAVAAFDNWVERRALCRIGVAAPLAMVGIGVGIVALTLEDVPQHDGRWVVVTSAGTVVADR